MIGYPSGCGGVGEVLVIGELRDASTDALYDVTSIDLTMTDGHLYGVATDGQGTDLLDIDPMTGHVLSVLPIALPGGDPEMIELAEGLASSGGTLLIGFKNGSPPATSDSNFLGELDPVSGLIGPFLDFADVGVFDSSGGGVFDKPDFDGLMHSSVVSRFVSSDHSPSLEQHAFHEISVSAPSPSATTVGVIDDDPPSDGLAINDLDESACMAGGSISGVNGGQSTPPTGYKALVGIDRTDGTIEWEAAYDASRSLTGLAGYDTAASPPLQFCMFCSAIVGPVSWSETIRWDPGHLPGSGDDVYVFMSTASIAAPESGASGARANRLRIAGSGASGEEARLVVSSTGELTVTGELFVASDGVFSIDGGDASIQVGELEAHGSSTLAWSFGAGGPSAVAVGGEANLGGELRVTLASGFVPEPSDAFTLITASTVVGQFENAASQLTTATGTFEVVYGAGSVTLTDFQPSPPVTIPFPAAPLAAVVLAAAAFAIGRVRPPARR